MTIVAELHDFRRFVTARALMAYLGLVPSEHSSGENIGAAASRRRATPSCDGCSSRPLALPASPRGREELKQRREGQPPRVIAIADKAQHRLCRRFRRLAAEHKPAPKVAVAIARELAGFLWAALQPAPVYRTAPSASDVMERTAKSADDSGTIQRTRELDMRQGLAPGLAPLDCTSSRRSTVMRALPRLAEVITGYQRDSSSKRPRSPSSSRPAPPHRVPRRTHGIQGCAPAGRRLRRPWTPHVRRDGLRLMPASGGLLAPATPLIERERGLTEGHSISALVVVIGHASCVIGHDVMTND